MKCLKSRCSPLVALTLWSLVAAASAQTTPGSIVYRCPGNVYTSEREITPKQAEEQGCKVIEGTAITVIQSPKPRGNATPTNVARGNNGEGKVDASQQRARDSDARKILEDELKKEEERLAALQKDYNAGEPERRGDERNYQRYLDRVAEMKAAVARKESDISAIKRELSKIVQ